MSKSAVNNVYYSAEFDPPKFISGANFQTVLSRVGVNYLRTFARKKYVQAHGSFVDIECQGKKSFVNDDASQTHVRNETESATLQAFYMPQENAEQQPLVLLIHGWLGCYESTYMLSAASELHKNGCSVLVLHLRDHGYSHHLNHDLFNSARIGEVYDAIRVMQKKYVASQYYLAGYSLGGNFALRVAANAPEQNIKLDKFMVICPLVNPTIAAQQIMNKAFYHRRFVKNWITSLNKKDELFSMGFDQQVLASKDYEVITEYFVEHHTVFASVEDYYSHYQITQQTLDNIKTNGMMIFAKDDPVIDYQNAKQLAGTTKVDIIATETGGHCGFQKDLWGNSWIDQKLLAYFA